MHTLVSTMCESYIHMSMYVLTQVFSTDVHIPD